MITPLQKIQIIAPRKQQKEILDILQSLGNVHIAERKKPKTIKLLQEKLDQVNFNLANIKFCLEFLNSHLKEKKSLKQILNLSKQKFSQKQIKKRANKLNIKKITKSIIDIEKNLEQGDIKKQQVNEQIQDLIPWSNLTELPIKTEYTQTYLGSLPNNKAENLKQKLIGKIRESIINQINQDSKKTYFKITFLKTDEEKIKNIFNEYNFQIKEQNWKELPVKTISELEKEKIRIKNNLKKWTKYIKKFQKYHEPLQMTEDYLNWEREKLESRKKISNTKFFIIIKAWIKKDNYKTLKKVLLDISPKILLEKIKPSKEENPPVLLENKGMFRPFETVTGIYGLPKYNEIDPTPFLAPFFIVFFGLCLSDAGYGLIMAIGCFLAIKLFKIPKESQRLWRLLAYGGIFTFIIGALLGGWFGIDISNLAPGPIKSFAEFFKLIDPMRDTVLFMGIAFALGLIQIWFSQIVKIIAALKNKQNQQVKSGIAWALFLLTAVGLLISKNLSYIFLSKVFQFALFLSIVWLILIESENTKNILVKPLVGLIAIIQRLIGFMSDTLSYSRLMALGLATGIIAFIINTIAVIFRDLIPYAGWLIWALILIGGHLFNLGINALGSFIHSGRLQFVEFFPKFIEGGGKKFQPLKKNSKYFQVKN